MELHLTKKTTLREVKKHFTSSFPYLKIEFFIYPHSVNEGSSYGKKNVDAIALWDIHGFSKEGVFHFKPEMTVAQFEQTLLKEFGLSVQVFRRSGSIWIETTETDNWSLRKQNDAGGLSLEKQSFNINTLFL